MKWDAIDERIASDLLAFVDDLRASGLSVEEAWQVARQVASRLQYLGIQDAPRKRRPPSQSPGAWAGGVFSTKSCKVTKCVTQDKWDKGKRLIDELVCESKLDPLHDFLYKRLEQVRGFLCHLSMTYETLTPFLKGFHLTLSSYLPHRDSDGWKLSDKQWEKHLLGRVEKGELDENEAQEIIEDERLSKAAENEWAAYLRQEVESDNMTENEFEAALDRGSSTGSAPPKTIKGVPRFFEDLKAFQALLSPDSPPEVTVRCLRIFTLLYGFGDASGRGFGSTVLGSDGTRYRIGVWDRATEDESSNFREFENVVLSLEEEADQGRLKDALVFFFTDNSTVESALYKGNSSSAKLFELIVRFRKLELVTGARFIISHVSGKRMIAEGTDGTSRGQLKEGVTIGENMLDFIPLDVSALDRTELLRPWLESWMGDGLEFLSPSGWFTRGHDHKGGTYDARGFWRHTFVPGTFIWSPPPAAADAALEELRKARIKRQESTHFFLCPRLLTTNWLKQLYKVADLVFHVLPGTPGWPKDMFEPLTIGIVFPFLRCRPWQFKGTPKMFYLARELRKVFKDPEMDGGDFLCKLLLDCRRLFSLQGDVVRRLLYFRSSSDVPRKAAGNGGRRKRKRPEGSGANYEGLGKGAPLS
jgi:hypothetical protein